MSLRVITDPGRTDLSRRHEEDNEWGIEEHHLPVKPKDFEKKWMLVL